ncbi:peptide-methionine (S)-S-oxide reductase MsrA [Colwellia sp. D2M02]|uniref:peptide-methionine (S)-S-oxide reductase MsrA n=1 Tax=Colwellia sp. D2M02 TaxID=2841562 RepID=UPI001C0A04B4|nr:peptide-methionine (S)-S-oxide reductase MsrA [Colwellia sp. D2M02]MBU2893728.1 peptide-methionine (S)-S-oxide reductase MsrA [Colwellia sp. D2M02]
MTEELAKNNIQVATLAGGCFWCIEGAYNSIQGIEKAISGYMGGETTTPTYEEVCKGTTGHAEVVQIHFDSTVISYRQLLEIFFSLHNPTHLNHQGNDVGTQYRSEIFTHNDEQVDVAKDILAEINENNTFDKPTVTNISPAVTFYAAEDYHQAYFKNNPENQYCQAVVSPKLAKFKKTFVEKLK